ncbi:MAG: CoA transferase [Eggerthellaceae bacterium]
MRGLEGIKVVELTGYVAAPACPRIPGEMGATIYKIEPASGDEYRRTALHSVCRRPISTTRRSISPP